MEKKDVLENGYKKGFARAEEKLSQQPSTALKWSISHVKHRPITDVLIHWTKTSSFYRCSLIDP
jgi:hypothetical protein